MIFITIYIEIKLMMGGIIGHLIASIHTSSRVIDGLCPSTLLLLCWKLFHYILTRVMWFFCYVSTQDSLLRLLCCGDKFHFQGVNLRHFIVVFLVCKSIYLRGNGYKYSLKMGLMYMQYGYSRARTILYALWHEVVNHLLVERITCCKFLSLK